MLKLEGEGEVGFGGAGTHQSAVVAEEDVGAFVAHLVGGVGGVVGGVVGVGGEGVSDDVVGPGDAGGFDEFGEVFVEAVDGEAECDAFGVDGVCGEDGAEVGSDGDCACLGGLGVAFGEGDIVGGEVGGHEALGLVGTEAGEESEGEVGAEVGLGVACGLEEGACLVDGEDGGACALGACEGEFGGGVGVGEVLLDGPGEEG